MNAQQIAQVVAAVMVAMQSMDQTKASPAPSKTDSPKKRQLAVKKSKPAPSKREKPDAATPKIRVTHAKYSVRVRFADKPNAEVVGALKEHGFHWSFKGKFWFAKKEPAAVQFADELRSKVLNG